MYGVNCLDARMEAENSLSSVCDKLLIDGSTIIEQLTHYTQMRNFIRIEAQKANYGQFNPIRFMVVWFKAVYKRVQL